MPDPTDLTTRSAEQLLRAYDAQWLQREDLLRQGVVADKWWREQLHAELLRRLRQWDALAMGPVDPPQEG